MKRFYDIKTYGGKTQKYSLNPEVHSYFLEHEQTDIILGM